MADRKEPKERIKELISKGYTKIQTIRALRNEGYGPDEVDIAMNEFLQDDAAPEPSPEPAEMGEPAKSRPPEPKQSYTGDNFEKELGLLRKQVEENRNMIESVSSKDLKKFKKVREHEVEDIVNFQAKLERMHEELKEDFKEMTEQMENFRSQMRAFEQNMEDIKKVEDDIKKLDIKQMRREIEILKTKGHWIEDNLEKIDMEPVVEKIKEVENKIDSLKAASPFVIE